MSYRPTVQVGRMGVDQRMNSFSIALRVAALSACLMMTIASAQAGLIDDNANDADHLALAAQPQYDSVGVVKQFGTNVDSSGILIAPNWVLTAAHTIPSGSPGPTDTWTFGSETRNIAQAIRNPNFTGNIANGFDIALHRLDSPITNVTPAQLYTGTAASLIGQTLTYVGYGQTGTGSTGASGPLGTKRAGNNFGEQLGFTLNPGPSQTVWSDQILFADMDAQTGQWGNPLGRTVPINLEYLIALGDSGGAAFVEQGGQHFLAGINSILFNFDPGATLGYGDVMGSTTIEQSLTWILDTIAPVVGDLDGDGFVGIEDLNIILGNWNLGVALGDLGLGDPSGDGFVGIEDLNIVLGNWNAGTPPPPVQAFAAVPEPAALCSMAILAAAVTQNRRRY